MRKNWKCKNNKNNRNKTLIFAEKLTLLNKPLPPSASDVVFKNFGWGGGMDFSLNLVSAGFAKNFNIFFVLFCLSNKLYLWYIFFMKEKIKIAVLVSGGGTNLQALIDYEKNTENCPYQIEIVIADTKKAYALERAQNAGIKTKIVSPFAVLGEQKAKTVSKEEKRIAVSDAALNAAKESGCDAIVLAGWLTVLSGKIIQEYSGKIVNLHPALLPKFGGVGMWGHNVHEAVLAAGEKESGCTVHLVDSGCDTGRILVQKKVPVMPGDTPETLYARIAPQEHKAMVEGVCQLAKMLSK